MNPQEIAEKYGATYTPPTPADLSLLATKYGAKYSSPMPQRQESGILGSALKTLVVKPAVRLGQAVGTPIAKALGATDEGIAQAQATPVEMPFGKEKITVEPQKALGQGGATQIFSDALKSASYLAPYGKIAGATSNVVSKVASPNVARVVGGFGAGASGGYAVDVSHDLDEDGEMRARAFIPGFATLIGGLSGGLLEGAGVVLEKSLNNARDLGRELEIQSFKLTPKQKADLGTRLDELVDFSAKNIPAGKAQQRFEYADDLVEAYEENLQFFLEQVAKEKRLTTSVNKNTLIRQLSAIKGGYKYDRDANAIYNQVDDAINTLRNQYKGESIPVDKLNIFKRSTFKNAYNKVGNKVLDSVEHDIGEAVKVAIERATKGGAINGKDIGQFNREYGNLLQLRKILSLAEGRGEGLSFTKRITARIIAGLIGNALGGIPGVVGAELVVDPVTTAVAGTSAKTNLSRKLMNIKPKEIGSVIQRLRP